jgi:hypothetical protein
MQKLNFNPSGQEGKMISYSVRARRRDCSVQHFHASRRIGLKIRMRIFFVK